MDMAHREPEPILKETTSNSLLTNTTRCCFCFPCFGSRKSSAVRLSFWQRIQSSSLGGDEHHHNHHHHHQWWSAGIRALKKIREWSEIVAGPKWKTFIRRFNRNNHRGGGGSGNGRHGGKFQYDPLSYALNFDEGPAGQNCDYDELDDYGAVRDFSSRFAPVPSASTKDVAVMA